MSTVIFSQPINFSYTDSTFSLDGRDGVPGEPGLDGVPGRAGADGNVVIV